MTGQAHGSGAVLAVSARIGERMHINAFDDALFGSTQPEMDLHLMAGRRSDLAFYPAENDLGGLFGFPGHKGGVYLADRCLLGTKAAADAGLGNTHHGFGDMQGIGNVAPRMEHDLGGAEHIQAAIGVDGAVGAEGFHHGLLAGFGVVDMVDDHIAGCKHCMSESISMLSVLSVSPAFALSAASASCAAVLTDVFFCTSSPV